MWNNFEFLNPEFLWLLAIVPLLALWYFFSRKKDSAQLTIPSVKGFNVKGSILPKLKPLLYLLRFIGIISINHCFSKT